MNEPSERLGELIEDLRDEDVVDIADAHYVFDNEDPYQTAEIWLRGVHDALTDIAAKTTDPKDIQVAYNADGDTVFLFVGTEDQIVAKLQAIDFDAIEASNDADSLQDEADAANRDEDDEDEDDEDED